MPPARRTVSDRPDSQGRSAQRTAASSEKSRAWPRWCHGLTERARPGQESPDPSGCPWRVRWTKGRAIPAGCGENGAAVHGGDELLSIVPAGEELLVEAKVPNQDIGFIRTGMRVKVKLATFPYQEYGMVEGTVSKISPNAVNEKDAGLVFPVQVRLKQHSVSVKGQEVPLTPGMVATAEIVTRQKTVLSFLLDPISGSWDRAFSVR
ncbi:MAG: HlyD family efflux transporter periplasmic adaptor subunit [Nitrospira sp.]|nr:HlyD family efflux transporter periplasmic adaptor subunit [Nitrospira sp.]